MSIFSTTFFITYLNESERQQLVDYRLKDYFDRLSEIDFTDKSELEIEEADSLSRDLKNAGVVWIWEKGKSKVYGGAKSYANLVEELCSTPGFSIAPESQTSIRCLKQKKTSKQPGILVAAILAKGTEPFFLSSKFYWYLGGIILFGFVLSLLVFQLVLSPLRELKTTTEVFYENLRSGHWNPDSVSRSLRSRSRRSFLLKDEFNQITSSYYSLLEQIGLLLDEFNRRSFQLIHEIKTPLAVLKNQIFELKKAQSDVASVRDKMQAIEDKIEHLNRFIIQFERYADAELPFAGQDELFSIDLRVAVEKVVREMSYLSQNRIQILGQGTFRVLSNQFDLEHLIQNLLVNAMKYSDSVVRVTLLEAGGLVIQDWGPGLPLQILETLGRPFNKIRGAHEQKPGFGLGLSICFAIARKYGWKLYFENTNPGLQIRVDFEQSLPALDGEKNSHWV